MIKLKFSSRIMAARWIIVVLAIFDLCCRASAQPVTDRPQRWLLVFDTSVAMKKCLPATTLELKNLFYNSFSSQLVANDSVGVWTFGEKFHPGRYPLINWLPENAAAESSKLITFIDNEHYSGHTKFSLLQGPLASVINHSERLTVVIFCDGRDTLKLTPYDDGINRTFKETLDQRKSANQPYVLVIRTQNGQYIGATVNLPPGSLELPPFPPLPPAPEVDSHAGHASAQTPVPAPPAAAAAPPLVIVGTNVVTDPDQIKKIDKP